MGGSFLFILTERYNRRRLPIGLAFGRRHSGLSANRLRPQFGIHKGSVDTGLGLDFTAPLSGRSASRSPTREHASACRTGGAHDQERGRQEGMREEHWNGHGEPRCSGGRMVTYPATYAASRPQGSNLEANRCGRFPRRGRHGSRKEHEAG